jgi:hypothetical protein
LDPARAVAFTRPGKPATLASNLPEGCGRSIAHMTNFLVYIIGTLFVVAGLAYGASRMGLSSTWIVAGALVIIGFGLMGGIVRTRQKDPAP